MIPRFSSLVLFAVLLAVTAHSSAASAEESRPPKPVLQVTTAVAYPVNVQSLTLLPPSILHGVGVGVPVGRAWSLYGEVDGVTGFVALRPGIQIIAGPTKKFGDRFALGTTLMYRAVPPYDGAETWTHLVGGSVAPIFPQSFGSTSFPIGVAYSVGTGDISVAANIKLALRLL